MLIGIALLGACHGDVVPPSQPSLTDPNWVTAGPDAPWGLHVTSALWATESQGTVGTLLLSDGTQNCDDLRNLNTNKLIGSLEGASGLLFVASRPDAGDEGFEGLYLTGYGDTSGNGGGFALSGGAFHDGVLWTLGYGGGMWLRIDDDSDTVTGQYYAMWWSGTFEAENCGLLTSSQTSYYDSGYGYGYYTGPYYGSGTYYY